MCCDTEHRIISAAIVVIEPCIDVCTERKTNTRQHIYCGFTTLSATFSLPWFVCRCFIFSSFHLSLVFHFHLFHYFPISEFHLNSTDYTLFLNDHSWGLWIQKPFSWLGPLGLPYITNHIHHWGLSTCKAYTYLDEHKSRENELKGCFLCVTVCLRVCMCYRKKEVVHLQCAHGISDAFMWLFHDVFSLYEEPSIGKLQAARSPAIWDHLSWWVCCMCGNICLLFCSTARSTLTRPKVWWRYCLISSLKRMRARTRHSWETAAPRTSSLWSLWIKVSHSLILSE